MTEVPNSPWTPDFDEKSALKIAAKLSLRQKSKGRIAWRRIPGLVRHTFTHFPLELVTYTARVPERTPAPAGMRWVARKDIAGEALPSVMRKVLAHAATKQD
jgi:A/G-specific adenine glycosylase